MTIHVYSSGDSGAPSILHTTGTGGLIRILDACMVNGYGSKVAAGWTKEYSGTNKAAYRLPASAALRGYLRVDDAHNEYAVVSGYASMSDVDTGTGRFPATGTDYYIHKTDGNAIYSSVSPWWLVTDGLFVYLFIAWIDANAYEMSQFGEFYSYVDGDTSPMLIACSTTGSSNNLAYLTCQSNTVLGRDDGYEFESYGQRLSSAFNGLSESVKYAQKSLGMVLGNNRGHLGGYPYVPYPDGVLGGLVLSPIFIMEQLGASASGCRGTLPGAYNPLQRVAVPPTPGSIFSGVTGLPGRDVMAMPFAFDDNNTMYAAMYFDVTGPWR